MVKPSDLILVAVMNNRKDMEIARLLGWYRIPLKTAPKVIAVDYLAFYQTSSFGSGKWLIETIAPVRGHELVTRAELFHDSPHHPRAAEEYFKIQIGPLEKLPKPIQAGNWKRITFLYTTGEYLLSATDVHDLVVVEDERKYLWNALRERAALSADYDPETLAEFDIPNELLTSLSGLNFLSD